jgi:1-acyl-sn-glycerol-3-phosphate acyltransferase
MKFLFRLLARMEVHGLENIPASGGCILATNHLSIVDAPFVFIHLKRNDITGMVAHKHRKNPFLRIIVNTVNGIWLNREEVDPQAIRAAVDWLKSGRGLGVAPEGTRSRTGQLIPAKSGVVYLADKAGVPVIPMAIWGTEKVFSELKHFRRATIHLTVGQPMVFPPIERHERDAALQRHTDALMCQIASMLPPEYRGVYSNK